MGVRISGISFSSTNMVKVSVIRTQNQIEDFLDTPGVTRSLGSVDTYAGDSITYNTNTGASGIGLFAYGNTTSNDSITYDTDVGASGIGLFAYGNTTSGDSTTYDTDTGASGIGLFAYGQTLAKEN